MNKNGINYVNYNTDKRVRKKSVNKTKDRFIMAAGGLVIFVLTFFIYGIMDEPDINGQKEIVTDNRDILAQIDQLEDQRKVKEEKLGMIKNDVFLGKNTDVDEYTASLLNDLKSLAEQSDSKSDRKEETDVEKNSSYSRSDENLNSILSYLEDDDSSDTIFNQGPNRSEPAHNEYRDKKTMRRVKSLYAFSNTMSSARIYNNGYEDLTAEISDRSETNNRIENGRNPDLMRLIFNSNPVFTISEGDFLTASITGRVLNDKRESPVTAVTTEDYLDNSGNYVLIPANSRITGFARKVSGQQDTRIFIDFHRMILPNGKKLELGTGKRSLTGMDNSGALGIRGKKNSHFFTKFGSSILYGSLNGLSGFAQNRLEQSSGLSRLIDRTSANFNTLNDRLASDSLAIVPTITLKAGSEVKIRFSCEIKISAYMKVSERTYY